MNGHGRNSITMPFKKRKKAERIPAKFDIEKDFSSHKSSVKCSDRRIQVFFLSLTKRRHLPTFHSFNKCFLNANYIPGTVLGTAVNKAK